MNEFNNGYIHLSGRCNRSCYYCIGQFRMDLDSYSSLNVFPLAGLDAFIEECLSQGIHRIVVTGTDTDPLLYRRTAELKTYLQERIEDLILVIHTNGVAIKENTEVWKLYDEASVHIDSFDPRIYNYMMGPGATPDIQTIVTLSQHMREVRLNVVLSSANVRGDIYHTIRRAASVGINRITLREPFGIAPIGDPFAATMEPTGECVGMPIYTVGESEVLYWDLAQARVNSVNLFADGSVTIDYPIVDLSATHMIAERRHHEQWVRTPRF